MRRLVGALVALLAFTAAAHAQNYPTRPITMLVGFPPGGPTDTLARILADGMQPSLGQSVVVETVAARAPPWRAAASSTRSPDGYTIGIGNWTSHVGSPAIYPLDYDIRQGSAADRAAGRFAAVDRRQERSAAEDGTELIAWLKANSDPATAATRRRRQRARICCGLYFAQKTGTQFQFVPYRGGAPAMQDMIGGTDRPCRAEASQTLAHVAAGRMKAFAVMGEQRWPKSPDDADHGSNWAFRTWTSRSGTACGRPKDTPKDVVARLDGAVHSGAGRSGRAPADRSVSA